MRKLSLITLCFVSYINAGEVTERTPLRQSDDILSDICRLEDPRQWPLQVSGGLNTANAIGSLIGFLVGVGRDDSSYINGFGVSAGASAVYVLGISWAFIKIDERIAKRHRVLQVSGINNSSFDSMRADDLVARVGHIRGDNKYGLKSLLAYGCALPLVASGASLVASAFYEDETKQKLQAGALGAGIVGGVNTVAVVGNYLRTNYSAKIIASRITNLFGA